jgi:small GTP-binding protein
MLMKMVCMLGAFSVGKTALVQRFVHSVFSEKYLSTIGVVISKKRMTVKGRELDFMLWDMEGKDNYTDVNLTYLRGAMGFFVVADGTRAETFSIALELRSRTLDIAKNIPGILLINKSDMSDRWELSQEQIDEARNRGISVMMTSAKEGTGINEAFQALGELMCPE